MTNLLKKEESFLFCFVFNEKFIPNLATGPEGLVSRVRVGGP